MEVEEIWLLIEKHNRYHRGIDILRRRSDEGYHDIKGKKAAAVLPRGQIKDQEWPGSIQAIMNKLKSIFDLGSVSVIKPAEAEEIRAVLLTESFRLGTSICGTAWGQLQKKRYLSLN